MGFVAVHTGAGNFVNEENYKQLCKRAAKKGCDILLNQSDDNNSAAVDACEMAIKILEDSCHTNAGYGSNLTWDGKIEMEASLMESKTMNFGSCTCVTDIKNPIELARRILDKQSSLFHFGRIPPVCLAGQGASSFAKELGLTMVPSEQLISKKAQNIYNYYRRKIREYETSNAIQISAQDSPLERLDTVGAIAIDDFGNIAAGCSSGGIVLKLSGRVGQAAFYGSGCWAQKIENQSTGAVTTGNGEYLIKTLLAKEICTSLYKCDCPTTKLNQVFIEKFLKCPILPRNQEYYAGALVIDYNSESGKGDLLYAHTTKMLCLGYKSTKQKFAKFICSTLPDTSQAGHKVIVGGISF